MWELSLQEWGVICRYIKTMHSCPREGRRVQELLCIYSIESNIKNCNNSLISIVLKICAFPEIILNWLSYCIVPKLHEDLEMRLENAHERISYFMQLNYFAQCPIFLLSSKAKFPMPKFFNKPLKIVLQWQEQMSAVNDFQI